MCALAGALRGGLGGVRGVCLRGRDLFPVRSGLVPDCKSATRSSHGLFTCNTLTKQFGGPNASDSTRHYGLTGNQSAFACQWRGLSSGEAVESELESLEVKPLPDGIDDSRPGLYELVGTEGTGEDKDGLRALLGVHGPPEYWPGFGGNFESAGGGSFAVIQAGGTDYKVTSGDTLYLNRIPGDVNTQVKFENILLVGTVKWSVFGRPQIPGASVTATVESQTRTAKALVTKFKKRKGYRRTRGHRQPITRVHIDSINFELPGMHDIVPHEVEIDPRRPPFPNNVPVL